MRSESGRRRGCAPSCDLRSLPSWFHDAERITFQEAMCRPFQSGRARNPVPAIPVGAWMIRSAREPESEVAADPGKMIHEGVTNGLSEADQAMQAGVHLLIVDLFPATARDPHGIHRAIWGEDREGNCAPGRRAAHPPLVRRSARSRGHPRARRRGRWLARHAPFLSTEI